MFSSHISDKGLLSRIHKEPCNFIANIPIYKWERCLSRNLFKKDIQMATKKKMKRCSTLLIKCRKTPPLMHFWFEYKKVQPLGKQYDSFLKR